MIFNCYVKICYTNYQRVPSTSFPPHPLHLAGFNAAKREKPEMPASAHMYWNLRVGPLASHSTAAMAGGWRVKTVEPRATDGAEPNGSTKQKSP